MAARAFEARAAALLALVALAWDGTARAHAPPMGTGLWWVPPAGKVAEHDRMVIRTPRGFLFESSATSDFRFLCNEALGILDNEEASFSDAGEAADNVLLVANWTRGLLRGSADGCNWAPVGADVTAPIFDIAVATTPSGPRTYAVGGAAHEGEHFWVAQDAGTGWSALANSDVPYTRVRVAPSHPSRVYLSGIGLNETGTFVHRLGVSDDAGQTIVDRPIALGPHDLQARLLGVDPLRFDHLFVWAESNTAEVPETLLTSQDGGKSFAAAATRLELRGFAQSEDGSRVWIGGKEGILRSVDGGQSFSAVSNNAMTGITCLAFHQNQLYACGVLDNRLVVAVSDDGGDDFHEILSFDRVKATVDCPNLDPASAPAAVCAASLGHWRSELGTLDAPSSNGTGGSSGAIPDAGTDMPTARADTAGCCIGGVRGRLAEQTSAAAILLALALGRPRRSLLRHRSSATGHGS